MLLRTDFLNMHEVRYPNFRQEVIDAIQPSEGQPNWITSMQHRVKGKKKDDLVVFGAGSRNHLSDISFYENPLNLDFDEGIEDDSVLSHWSKLILRKVKYPSSCISADVTGNGFNDLVLTCEYGESLEAIDPYGGRICWLENFGTNEGDWSCHEIGRFPGVNCIKVGHFTTTYSLQLLAVEKSSRTEAFSPLVIFTRPPDVYKAKYWLVATALENVFSSIQDPLVIPGSGGALDSALISSKEGLSVVWYHGRRWLHRPLNCTNLLSGYLPGKLRTGRIARDPVAFIVSTEASGSGRVSLFSKDSRIGQRREFRDISWSHRIIDDFSSDYGDSNLDILCEDFDGDGVDEIIISVSTRGPNAGVYCFDLQQNEGTFIKYKLFDEPVAKLTCGHFALRNRLDLALITSSNPSRALVLYNSYVSTQIKPSIEGSELILSVPPLASSICEIDVIDTAGYTISLAILPPNASYDTSVDASEAIKVLYGLLGWVDSQSEIIERTRVTCRPGYAASLLVDSPEGRVRSGNDGAVFVRMRPSHMTDAVALKASNVLPSYFPCNVRDYKFAWCPVEQDGAGMEGDGTSLSSSGNCTSIFHSFTFLHLHDRLSTSALYIVYHLSGFRVRFHDSTSTKAGAMEDTIISNVRFWAARPGTSTRFTRDVTIPSTSDDASPTTCTIHACLSNPTGEGGLLYCNDPFDWSSTVPTPHQISRAQKLIIPAMYEHGPLWRTSKNLETTEADGHGLEVEYPWHSWMTGRASRKCKEQRRWNVWVALDFPAFELEDSSEREESSCIIC